MERGDARPRPPSPAWRCAICLEARCAALWRCGGCGGALHAACFARWMRRSCPLCRRPAADVIEDLDVCTTIALALVVSGAVLALAWAAEADAWAAEADG